MNGVLILAHGSRVKSTKDTINTVVEKVKEQVKEVPIEIAYMELCEETIEKGIDKLVKLGVKDIKVVPYFLFEGIHIRKDIPEEIEKVLKNYDGINVTMGKTLGVDDRLVQILVDRINN